MSNLMLIISEEPPFNGEMVMEACRWLKEHGFVKTNPDNVEINPKIFVIPTEELRSFLNQ